EASARVVIGDGARLGLFCKVLDNDFHTIVNLDHRPPSQPVKIGAASTIGDRAILLPGACVKPGESIPPGTVVWGPRRATTGIRVNQSALAASAARGRGRVIEGLRHPLNSLRVLLSWMRAFLLFRREERSSGIRVHGSLRVERGGTLRV